MSHTRSYGPCPMGGTHVLQQIYIPAFEDGPSNICYKCGHSVNRRGN